MALASPSASIQTSNFIHLVSPFCTAEPLKEQILKGDVHTIDEMRAWLKPLAYSDTIIEAAINFILREFVMCKFSCDEMSNMDMIVELLCPQMEVTK